MPRTLLYGLLMSTLSLPLQAAQDFSGPQTFQCGGATVRIDVDHALPLYDTEGAEVTLQVERNADKRATLLRYSGGVDFIGGLCDTDAQGSPRVVFQAYCGGSGCNDLENWGVIDPQFFKVLLAPADYSLAPAKRILGHVPRLNGPVMSVSRVAHGYGLPTP